VGPNLVRLSKDAACWIDRQNKSVIVEGEVCLREGYLEMFACLKGTKEHESVVALNSRAYVIHAALLAVGAKVGHPARYQPSYEPASGTGIDVLVEWTDTEGKQRRVSAQEWIRNVKTREKMQQEWVFAGSGFWTDPDTGKRYYRAEGGEVICVSNFTTAMLDLPIESSQANAELLFEAFTENIPARGTKVRVILAPKLSKPAQQASEPRQ
jgi:hypothetical protein